MRAPCTATAALPPIHTYQRQLLRLVQMYHKRIYLNAACLGSDVSVIVAAFLLSRARVSLQVDIPRTAFRKNVFKGYDSGNAATTL